MSPLRKQGFRAKNRIPAFAGMTNIVSATGTSQDNDKLKKQINTWSKQNSFQLAYNSLAQMEGVFYFLDKTIGRKLLTGQICCLCLLLHELDARNRPVRQDCCQCLAVKTDVFLSYPADLSGFIRFRHRLGALAKRSVPHGP